MGFVELKVQICHNIFTRFYLTKKHLADAGCSSFLFFFFVFLDPINTVTGGCHCENIRGCHYEIQMTDVINKPENYGYNNNPFKKDYVIGIDKPCKNRHGNYRDPGYWVERNCADGKNYLENDKSDFKCRRSFDF